MSVFTDDELERIADALQHESDPLANDIKRKIKVILPSLYPVGLTRMYTGVGFASEKALTTSVEGAFEVPPAGVHLSNSLGDMIREASRRADAREAVPDSSEPPK